MTKQELAAKSGVSARSLTWYESGERSPSAESEGLLAQALGFPVSFFYAPEPASISSESASFRSLAKMTARQRDSALASGELAIELDDWFTSHFTRPEPQVPDLRQVNPEAAAEAVRAEWRLGLRPIQNAIHLLEAHGIRVYSLMYEGREVDAFSLWRGDTPFIFLNTSPDKTAERLRFDVVHELGHLVLHRHGSPVGKEAEAEADRFASAFLMPRSDVIAYAPRYATPEVIIRLKQRWGVSALALTYRLHSLELISDWHYQQLCIHFRSKYGSAEPAGMARESSQALAKMLAALRAEGVSRAKIAAHLSIHPEDLDHLVFGLVMTGTKGGGSSSSPNGTDDHSRPKLTVI